MTDLPPHAPIAIGPTVYGDGTLDWYRRAGFTHLRVWCVHCTHWDWLHLETLLGKVGAGTSLMQLARRSKCNSCRRKGARRPRSAILRMWQSRWLGAPVAVSLGTAVERGGMITSASGAWAATAR